jgi:hypothetical protein
MVGALLLGVVAVALVAACAYALTRKADDR